jgi:hypothetical protein
MYVATCKPKFDVSSSPTFDDSSGSANWLAHSDDPPTILPLVTHRFQCIKADIVNPSKPRSAMTGAMLIRMHHVPGTVQQACTELAGMRQDDPGSGVLGLYGVPRFA